jgi:outer membrane protein TolC
MKHPVFGLLLLATSGLAFCPPPTVSAQAGARLLRVTILTDGPSPQLVTPIKAFQTELVELLGGNVEFVTPPIAPDWTMHGVTQALDAALADRSVRLIVGFGSMVGVAVGRKKALAKPVLLPFAVPELQGLPRKGDRSGRRNLAYLTDELDLERELGSLLEVARFERLAFIVGAEIVSELDDPSGPIMSASQRLGIQTHIVSAREDVWEALEAIPTGSEAVYIATIPRWTDEQMQDLIDGLNERALPSYADGLHWVERGALMTTKTREDEIRRLRRAALHARAIHRGQPASELPVTFRFHPQLVINVATADAIGVSPTFSVLSEARLIREDSAAIGPTIALDSAMLAAPRANLTLMADRIGVDAGRENVNVARGEWFIAAEAGAEYRWIDRGIADPLGRAERQFDWFVEGRQLLYSARSHGNLRSQRDQQQALVDTYYSARLDIMLEAGEAYLDVLRAKNNERVSRYNLELTRKNLALAETRNEIGVAGRDEVIRWEIEMADSRARLIQAVATRKQTELAFNRVLNRPLEAPFQTPPGQSSRGIAYAEDPRFGEFIQNPRSFDLFRDFMSQEGIANSPEIKAIANDISAQQEILMAERRTLGIPDVAVVGGFRHIPHVSGAGAQPPPNLGATRDTFSWSVGVTGALTLFNGAQNYAQIRQAGLQVDQLETERAALAQQIDERVRGSLQQVIASSANIELSRAAANAANRNLEMVTDAYQRGTVDIVRLIDAQNQAVTNDLAAANATYDYLIDVLRTERAVGVFTVDRTQEEQEDFLRRLYAYAENWKSPTPAPTFEEPGTNPTEMQ